MPSVVVLNGNQKDERYEIRGGETLGRDQANSIQISAPGVSRRHLQFAQENDAIWIVDLGSANGTSINGTRVSKQKLYDGDVITLSTVNIQYHEGDSSTAIPARGGLAGRPHVATEPLIEASRFAQFLQEEDAGAKPRAADYTVDARQSFTQFSTTDLGLSHKDQVSLLKKRLTLLFEIQQSLAAVKDRDELLGKMMEKLFEVFPQAHRGLVLLGPSVDDLEPAIVRQRHGEETDTAPKLSRTIAREVYEQKKAILASDAEADERFSGALSLVDMDIRSFIVAPLLFREEVFGFIQLDSHESRKRFTPDDLNLLAGLASSAALFLKSLKLFEAVAREVKEREAIHSELRVASRIQAGLLPRKDPDSPWLEVGGRMRTAKEVGGDYYDYLTGGDESAHASSDLYVVIGDVSGKGVPAGLVMVMARSILRSLTARGVVEPKALAVETNRLLKRDLKPGMFLSLLLGRIEPGTKSIRFAGCGHERPLVYRARTRKVERLDLGGLVLGVLPDNSKNVAEVEVALEPGDQVLLYTDGVPEAMNEAGKQYSIDRLETTLATYGHTPPGALLDAIEQDVARHVLEADQHDDITLIALRRKA